MRLLDRLDDWQHLCLPNGARHPRLQQAWYYFWRPLCNYVEWRNLRHEDEPYRPFADYTFTTNATLTTNATPAHTEYSQPGRPTQIRCNVQDCTICRSRRPSPRSG